MKFLSHARDRARTLRQRIGLSSANLLDRIEQHILETYKIELIAVDKKLIDGGRAELRPEEGCLYYDQSLNSRPEQKLWVIAHELGHLEIHGPRLLKHGSEPDPVYGSMYGSTGPNSLTRYNKRSQEEAEANAFAAEFLCPSRDAFQHWRSNPGSRSEDLAERFGAPLFVVRTQLAEALYGLVFGDVTEKVHEKKEFACDPSQEAAATFTGRPALIDAGPGTGKTATLVRRIEYLIEDEKAEPSSILVLTFSNDACNELLSRITSKFGDAVASQIRITTFHGFGLSLVQHHGQFSNIDANAAVMDDAAQEELISEAIGRAGGTKIIQLSRIADTIKEVKRHITFLKERAITCGRFRESIDEWDAVDSGASKKEEAQELLKIFRDYEALKHEREKLDFADLILESIKILDIPEIADAYQQKFPWVLVDEYQDVSKATAVLLRQLCGRGNPAWVVGDKRQSIFAFCGAYRENMDEFDSLFSGATRFSLNINYRAAEHLVSNANVLANLIDPPRDGNPKEYWTAGRKNPTPPTDLIVSRAVATSDDAEHAGIVDQIQSWRNAGVEFGDIAVLARRNVDVRNIVLSLGRNRVPAIASGIVTSEGAAGDLANVLTFADRPRSSIAGLVYALAKHRFNSKVLNRYVAALLDQDSDPDRPFEADAGVIDFELAAEINSIHTALSSESFSSDGFSAICNFLFDSSGYLRRVLASEDEIQRSLALNEIVTTLTEAATYRFAHAGVPPRRSRRGFAESFRGSLALSATPSTSPPKRWDLDAVQVMTCHASKGLEFPYVMVAGQTLSEMGTKGEYKWLPPQIAPKPERDLEQSDSMFFVGSTRAKNALVASHATAATELSGSRRRNVIPLLAKWSEQLGSPPAEWTADAGVRKEKVEIDAIWGGSIRYPLVSRKLDKEQCSIATYLENGLRLRYPTKEAPMYPTFFVVVRDVLGLLVKKAFEQQVSVAEGDALKMLTEEWEKKEIEKEHVHHDLYLSYAKRYVTRFAAALGPPPPSAEFIDVVFPAGGPEGITLDIATAFTDGGQICEAMIFRPESLTAKLNARGSMPWGKLTAKYRVPLVMLRNAFPNLQVKVFSGEDGRFFNFEWPTAKYVEDQTAAVLKKKGELSDGIFQTEVTSYACDRCGNRLACPVWIGATNGGVTL